MHFLLELIKGRITKKKVCVFWTGFVFKKKSWVEIAELHVCFSEHPVTEFVWGTWTWLHSSESSRKSNFQPWYLELRRFLHNWKNSKICTFKQNFKEINTMFENQFLRAFKQIYSCPGTSTKSLTRGSKVSCTQKTQNFLKQSKTTFVWKCALVVAGAGK